MLDEIRLLFQDVILLKIVDAAENCVEKKIPPRGLDRTLLTICLACVYECYNALFDLDAYNNPSCCRSLISQRQTYFSARFALESAADLVYLKRCPKELDNFIVDSDFVSKEIRKRDRIKNAIERDLKVAEAIKNSSRLEMTTTERIRKIFPGEGVSQYATLCLMTHNNDAGNLLFMVENESHMVQLILHIVRTLRIALSGAGEYFLSNNLFDIDGEKFNLLKQLMRNLEWESQKFLSDYRP